ncbi:S-layer homology domain-containing protein [Paenibacillus aurantiacus]|uniref:S-layer homology domain-containing protein n=1 Tax=Paenibacillus aurantiacus TaxID=1936118 RepID=A0ABV5KYD7_9BACL
MRKSTIGLLTVMVLGASQSFAQPQAAGAASAQATFFAAGDTNEEHGDMYGTDPEMYIGRLYNPGDGLDLIENSAIRFDLSSISGTVSQATLKLFVNYDSGNPAQTIKVWGSANNDLSDTSPTLPVYDSANTSPGNYKVYSGPFPDGAYITIDVTEIVKANVNLRDHSDNMVTLVLTGTETPNINSRISVAARESGKPAELSVTTSVNQAPTGSISVENNAVATNKTTVTLNITGADADGDSLQAAFSNDGTTWSSPQPLGTSAFWTLQAGDGTKTVYMRLYDGSDYSPVYSDTITLDTAPPAVTGVSSGAVYNADRTITFTDGTATLNGAPFASGGTASAEGASTLIVTDAAGNQTTVAFTIDKTKPTGTVKINDGAAATGSTQVNLAITSSDPGGAAASGVTQMQFSTDGGTTWSAQEPVAASKSLALPAGDGEKIVHVRFTDKAGNVSDAVFDAITLDTTGPVITGAANNGLYKAAPTITFDEGTAKLDGSAFASGSAAGGEGSHTLVVTDAAGNASTITFFVDTVKPTGSVSINEGADQTNTAEVRLTLASNDPGGAAASGVTQMQFSTDGGTTWSAQEPVAASKSITLPAGDGEKTVHVRFTDKAGNVSDDVSDAITLDTTGPVITGAANNGLYKAAPTITFDEGTAKLDGSAFASGSAAGGEGSHTLVVTDAAGNASTITFFVDTVKPTGSVSINEGADQTNTAEVRLTLASNDPGGAAASGVTQMQFSTDGTTWSAQEPVAASKSIALPAGDGEKTVHVRFTDKAGNVSDAVNDAITLDTTPPVVTGVQDKASYTSARTITFNEGTATLDNNPFVSGTAVSSLGSHTLIVTDRAGNKTTVTFTIDSTSTPTDPGNPEEIRLNQDLKPYGSGKITFDNGVKKTAITLDPAKIDTLLPTLPLNTFLTFPVRHQSNQVTLSLDGRMIGQLGNKQAAFVLQTPDASYTLAAQQLDLAGVLAKLGSGADPKDITFRIEVAKIPQDQIVFAPSGNSTIVTITPGIEFHVTAVYQGKSIEVKQFNSYVERSIAIPAGIDPATIKTGVVIGRDGSPFHVPTRMVKKDGVYYAIIRSMSNSVYAVIAHDRIFTDTAGHWAQSSIKNMADRLIVDGVNSSRFYPNAPISRAEFTSIVVRALGLNQASATAAFTDLKAEDRYAEAVSIAVDRGLVSGFADRSFKPNASITRAEAMVILAKAMTVAGLDTAMTDAQTRTVLASFADADKLGFWSRTATALGVKFGIMKGAAGKVQPDRSLTRAETAVMVERMLLSAQLIHTPME